jgi:N,N'-diacetyllegionaminate synthase
MNKCFIIAEAGINHNGDIKIAKRLADAAKESGADAVKYQTFWNITWLEKYELTKPEWKELKRYCDKIDIQFMSTPHTMDAINFVDPLVEIHKIASPFLYYYNFLKEIAGKNKPILLSTGNHMSDSGMAEPDEIKNAIRWIENNTILEDGITLLHCVSKYPLQDPHLERIDELKKLFGKPVGLSDHTKDIDIEINIPVIEKHFMLPDVPCIDKNVSLMPKQFKRMVDCLRSI